MKGQALVWFREYADSCKCPDSRHHRHRGRYRFGDNPSVRFFPMCRSWSSELKMVWELWLELGLQPRVSVAFQSERGDYSWQLLGPPLHPGEWERYGEPTLEQSLAMTANASVTSVTFWDSMFHVSSSVWIRNTEQAFAELDMELSKPASPSATASTLDLTGYGRP